MSDNVTLLSIRTDVRRRADMVNSNFIDDATLNGWINKSVKTLVDIIVSKYGEDYYSSTYTFTTTTNTDLYNLPPDFYKLLGIEAKLSGNDWIELLRLNFRNRNIYNYSPFYAGYIDYPKYKLQGSQILLRPVPQAGMEVRIWYVNVPGTLVADGDTFDFINGWDDFVACDVAIRCLNPEESDVSALMAQKAEITERILRTATFRDAGQPARVTKVMGRRNLYGWPL